jgi:drug/metabolite transporter (DMT)-like permease
MHTRHFVQLIAMSALWGASFPFLRIAAPALGPWVTAGLRVSLAALTLSLLMRILRNRWPPRDAWLRLSFVSLLTVVLPFVLFNYAAPLFGVIGAALAGEERITGRRLLGCALGFIGVALLVQLGPVAVTSQVIVAALFCTVAAGCYGFGAILMKRATLAWQPLPSSAAVHVAAAVLLVVPMGLAAPSAHPTLASLVAVGTLGIITSGFMYWISMRLMREIPASASTSSAFMIPLFGVTWGGLFLGEPVTAGMIPGCLLVLVAMALITGFNPFRSVPPEP